ncbi:MAG: DUF4383 domain-containing protein [bacterium]|nr:DUF4383 domain-containing protein [bacterium]
MQKLARIFGVVFVAIGVLGFVPGITSDGSLLGIFQVDTMHNIIHLITGVLAFWAASGAGKNARLFFQVFGVVYAIVTVVGFMQGDTVLGIIAVNMADNVLHLVIAVGALYVGFGMKEAAGAPVTV